MKKIPRLVFYLTVLAYILYVTNCFVQIVMPKNSAIFMLAVFAICILTHPMILLRDSAFYCGLAYSACLIIWPVIFHPLSGFNYGSGDLDTALIEIAFFLPSLAISSILYKLNDKDLIHYVTVGIVLSIFTSLLYVFPMVLFDNSIARTVTATEAFQGENLIPGFWSYQMLHVVALYIPVYWGVCAYLGRKQKIRIIYLLSLMMLIVVTIQSSIMTMFVYLILVLFFLFNISIHTKKWRLYIYFIELLLLAYMIGDSINIVDKLISYYDGTDMYEKLEDVRSLLAGNSDSNSTISERADFQEDAISSFLDSPIIGMSYSGGAHSIIFNRMGSLGILGFLPFAMMLIIHIVRWYYRLSFPLRKYYFLSIFGGLLLMTTKGVFGVEGWVSLLIIIPVLLCNYSNDGKCVSSQESNHNCRGLSNVSDQ